MSDIELDRSEFSKQHTEIALYKRMLIDSTFILFSILYELKIVLITTSHFQNIHLGKESPLKHGHF